MSIIPTVSEDLEIIKELEFLSDHIFPSMWHYSFYFPTLKRACYYIDAYIAFFSDF